ncbi:hypothetical protein, partial [Alloprevotella tannerae]|uniref:hypothetical protein n=1 Tax=Alloprevotella tannerae TaxID=76122 RepID=UPI0025E78E12
NFYSFVIEKVSTYSVHYIGRSEGNYRRLLIKPSKEKNGPADCSQWRDEAMRRQRSKKAGTGSCRRLLVA